jgi:RHS repeat-associated protein
VAGAWQLASDHRYLYDGWNLVAILDGNQILLYSFMWGTDVSGTLQAAGGVGGVISMTVHTGPLAGTYFSCYDGNGNVVALVKATDGTVAAQYEYGPFGELLRATGPMAFINSFRFSTKFQDDETGFLYYGYRYYTPSTGRWLSRDPIAERGDPSLYAAFASTAGNVFDPNGKDNMYFQLYPGYSLSVQNAPVNFGFFKTYQTRTVYRPPPTYFAAPGSRIIGRPGYYERVLTGEITFETRALGTDPLAAAVVYAPRSLLALHSFSIADVIEKSDLPQDQKARLHFLNAAGQLILLALQRHFLLALFCETDSVFGVIESRWV